MYHDDPIEAQVCPICNPGVSSEEVAEEAIRKAHQHQELVWAILKIIPDELFSAEVERRRLLNEARNR